MSSKIYCYIKCVNSSLKRYKGKNEFFQRGINKWISKREKVYLLSKYQRRGCLTEMKLYGNKILRKYLSLYTCNFPISDYISLSHRVDCDKLKLCYDIEKNPGPSFVNVDAAKTISAPYRPGNVAIFGRNAGQQCIFFFFISFAIPKYNNYNNYNYYHKAYMHKLTTHLSTRAIPQLHTR